MNKKLLEEWKEISGYLNYDISNLGNVRSWKKGRYGSREKPRIIKQTLNKPLNRYYVMLSLKGGIKNLCTHTLVAKAFIGPRPDGMDCCHNDGNCINNRVDNLRYDTRKGNFNDMIKHGTRRMGSKIKNSKLIESDIPKIFSLFKEGFSQRNIAKECGVSQGNISMILSGIRWKHVKEELGVNTVAVILRFMN